MPEQKNAIPAGITGLVACGGKSNRMGTDKSLLTYYGKAQRYHIYNMLLPICEKVFLSINHEQHGNIENGYYFLEDLPEFNNTGPMAALLTAFAQLPQQNILLIGCDYPFLTIRQLQHFTRLLPAGTPASFYNERAALYEPLLAWYPYTCFEELQKKYMAKQYSLQRFLQDMQAIKYYPGNKNSMISVDTPGAFATLHKFIPAGPGDLSKFEL